MGWTWASIDWATTWSGVQGMAATGALVFVVVQVTRDGRARRAKDRAILTAAFKATWLGRSSVAAWVLAGPKTDDRQAARVLLTVSHLRSMLTELQSLPLHELPSPAAVTCVLKVRALFSIVVAEAETILGTGHRRPAFPEDALIGLRAAEADLRALCASMGVSKADLEIILPSAAPPASSAGETGADGGQHG